MTYLKVGGVVMIALPPEDKRNNPVAEFEGEQTYITKRVLLKKTTVQYYELAGATSKYGIPYSFVREWLIPID